MSDLELRKRLRVYAAFYDHISLVVTKRQAQEIADLLEAKDLDSKVSFGWPDILKAFSLGIMTATLILKLFLWLSG